MGAVGWFRFFAMLMPDLKDLARELFRWHKGDVEAARASLVHIRNHGLRLDIAEAEIDARMARAKADSEEPH